MKKKPKNLRQVNALTIIIFVCAIFWLMPLVLIFINSFKPYNDMLQDLWRRWQPISSQEQKADLAKYALF